MIQNATGNLLTTDVEALVNTVNCVGHMGKGIALQFKQAFPDNYKAYKRACDRRGVEPGKMFIFPTESMSNPRFVVNFPTKQHWRGKSRIEDVESGLVALVADVKRLGIKSIAVPPLGCGNGGLSWSDVRPLIVAAFDQVPDVVVHLFAPSGSPDPKAMPVRTKPANMTPARAILIKVIQQYLGFAYQLTHLEVQKLAYFLQEEAGEPLKLKYEAGFYGPYAQNLTKLLQHIEGHFTRGYGDNPRPDHEIELLPGAVERAEEVVSRSPESVARLRAVAELIEGFETPYGMELLSSVHWVVKHSPPNSVSTPEDAVAAVHAWNERKRKLLKPEHVRVAWEHLLELDRLPAPAR